MSRRFVVIFVIVFLLSLLTTTYYLVTRHQGHQAYNISVTGQPGTDVVGYVNVDGARQSVTGKLPLTLHYSGRMIEFAIASAAEDPTTTISVALMIGDTIWGSVTAVGIRGRIDNRGMTFFGRANGYIGSMSSAEVVELQKK